ncbi:MAG: Type 1 glutamine amidotransferase-like domain-containing protein [candidate division FCPU426 bacterium]
MNRIKPVYLMAGGNWRKPSALLPQFQTILAETGKPRPLVATIGAANGDDAFFFRFTRHWLLRAGAGEVMPVRLASKRADAARALEILQAADAVFLSGGDVDEGMRWLKHHGIIPALRGLRRRGKLFFGLSAGSIMLGTRWVRWPDENNDDSAELFECLGLAPVLCDTHAEEDDWEELKTAVRLLAGRGCGYGIPTGGAIRVSPSGTLTAFGQPAVRYLRKHGQAVKAEDLPAKPF